MTTSWEMSKIARESFIKQMQKEVFTEADTISCVDLIKVVGPEDDEMAHSMEKALWQRVLKELAKDNAMAETALHTLDVDFSRWFA
jgi:2-phospho-L-lactate guanylyltransferase (CobY/MobA/RfbA family)